MENIVMITRKLLSGATVGVIARIPNAQTN